MSDLPYLQQLLKTQKIQNVESILTTKQVKIQNRIKMIELSMFIAFLLFVGGYIFWKRFEIRRKYKNMIDYIDETGAAIDWSGFDVALYYEYPHLPGNKFFDTAFPAAVVYSFYTAAWHDCFADSKGANMMEMWLFSKLGTNDPTSKGDLSPLALICNTWAYKYNITDCKLPCNNPTAPGGIAGIGQSAVSWGMQGAMAGGMIGPEGAGIGIAVGALIGAGLGIFKSTQQSKQCKESTERCIKPKGFSCSAWQV